MLSTNYIGIVLFLLNDYFRVVLFKHYNAIIYQVGFVTACLKCYEMKISVHFKSKCYVMNINMTDKGPVERNFSALLTLQVPLVDLTLLTALVPKILREKFVCTASTMQRINYRILAASVDLPRMSYSIHAASVTHRMSYSL